MLQPGDLGGFESVVNVWRQPERVTQLQVLVPQVKVIQPVEPDLMIFGRGQDRLPDFLILVFGIDGRCLDDKEPRPVSLPVRALQDTEFTTLDVDLHEVNGPILDMDVAKVREPNDLDLARRRGQLGDGEAIGDSAFERRVFSEFWNFVKRRMARPVAYCALQIFVPRPSLAQQRVVASGRFNIEPRPSQIIKMPGNRKEVGVSGTDVDIKTAMPGIEKPRDHHIFEILGI